MKYCANCGTSMEDTAAFCPNCGAAANTEAAPAETAVETPVSQPTYTYTAPAAQLPTSTLVLAILGCAFGCLYYTSIVGIILSAIARGKVKAAKAQGITGGKLKASDIVSKIGLILSIVLTVIFIIAIIAGVIIGLNSYSNY